MKLYFLPVLGIFFGCLLAAQAGAAQNGSLKSLRPVSPDSAMIYSNEAEVSVEERKTPQHAGQAGSGFVLALPVQVRRDTLTVHINGEPASTVIWLDDEEQDEPTLDPAEERSPERKALLEKRLELLLQKARLQGELEAVQTRVGLLQMPLSSEAPLQNEDILRLGALADAHMPGLFARRAALEQALASFDLKIAVAEQELARSTRRHQSALALVPAGPDRGEATVRYSYVVPAQATTSYTVRALPEAGTVTVEQEVVLLQTTGIPWEQTDVTLFGAARQTGLRPAQPHPWQVGRRVAYAPAAAERKMAPQSMAEASADMIMESVAPVVQEELSTFRIWKLGRRSLSTDAPVRIGLSTETLAAQFGYTLRPAQSPLGFLTATLTSPAPLEIPSGTARFLVDGAVLGQGRFSFHGTSGTVFFGSDPQVTAVMRDLKSVAGTQGLLSKEQTYEWDWEIEVTNHRARAVAVAVEDPAPESTDEAIKITSHSSPAPESVLLEPDLGGTRILRWKTVLEPGASQTISHKVRLVAPVDMPLNLGR